MHRKALYDLLKRYLEGDCTAEEKELVEQWYGLLGDEAAVSQSEADIKDTVQRLWPSIQQQTLQSENSVGPAKAQRVKTVRLFARVAIAAAIIIGVAVSIWLFKRTESISRYAGRSPGNDFTEIINRTSTKDTLLLSDSTFVVLDPQARLYYPQRFSDKREVYLEGNAFFKVTRNPRKPFYVYSRNIVTQVLGTSFFVRANKDVEVSVRTGKVAVYESGQETTNDRSNAESRGVILKPNQRVIYNRADHHFRTTLVEMPMPVVIDNEFEEVVTGLNFVFEEMPISEVLAHLEKAYHIEMVLENETLSNCLFSGDIKGQDLYDQLEIICQSVQASYEVRGTRILIKGSGCE